MILSNAEAELNQCRDKYFQEGVEAGRETALMQDTEEAYNKGLQDCRLDIEPHPPITID